MQTSGTVDRGVYDAKDMAEISIAIDAVCAELGIDSTDKVRRERVAGRIMRSWASGRRMPLWLVQAGLDEIA